jgi:hypothetical protein
MALPKNPTMRDINDHCVANGLPSLAQGMIELPPPLKLRQLAAEFALKDDGWSSLSCLMCQSTLTEIDLAKRTTATLWRIF